MAHRYATDDEVFTLGLTARAFVVAPRPVAPVDVDAATGTIRLKGHGFSALDLVAFEVTSGGSLPYELPAFETRSPIIVSADLLRVADPDTGDAIAPFSSVGAGWAISLDPRRRIGMHAEEVSGRIDQRLTAHAPPILVDPNTGKYHPVLVGLCARMTARAAVTSLQIENAAYRVAVDRLFASEAADAAMLEQLREGWPLNPRPVDATDAPDNGARAASGRDAVPWQTGLL